MAANLTSIQWLRGDYMESDPNVRTALEPCSKLRCMCFTCHTAPWTRFVTVHHSFDTVLSPPCLHFYRCRVSILEPMKPTELPSIASRRGIEDALVWRMCLPEA